MARPSCATSGSSSSTPAARRMSYSRKIVGLNMWDSFLILAREEHVARALVPAVSRLVSTLFAGATRCTTKSGPKGGDGGGQECRPHVMPHRRLQEIRAKITLAGHS